MRIIGNDIRERDLEIFDLSNLTHMDDSAAYLIALLFDRTRQSRIEIMFVGIPDKVREVVHAFDVLQRVPTERVVDTHELAKRTLN